jgi:hypothetical protein
LEPIQVETPYRVVVTFLEPIERDTSTTGEDNLERFIGMWADFTPEEDHAFQTILEERASYFAGRETELDREESTRLVVRRMSGAGAQDTASVR